VAVALAIVGAGLREELRGNGIRSRQLPVQPIDNSANQLTQMQQVHIIQMG
jgi:hypothetical protein